MPWCMWHLLRPSPMLILPEALSFSKSMTAEICKVAVST